MVTGLLRVGTAVVVFGLAACSSDQVDRRDAGSPEVGGTQTEGAQIEGAQIERGRTVYVEQKCQACHSIAGVGSRRYPLDGVGSTLSPDDIRKWIVSPLEMNPKVSKRAFDTLPPADLEALVAYVSSLQKS
jgi:mono/diheme cytochrome c family protein